jgi:hypothetical protein
LSKHPIPAEPMTQDLADRAARGLVTLYRFGRPCSRKLRPAEWAAYEAAKVNHYVETNHVDVSNAYYRWCAADPVVPFIRVEPRRHSAKVRMDLITLGGGDLGQEAAREALALVRRFAVPPCFFGVGVVTWCSRVRREDAGQVAAGLWAIATAPRPLPVAAIHPGEGG